MSDLQIGLERIQGHVRLPSIVAGVATAGTVSWVGGAGDVPGEPADTQYRIGSITKTMTAVLVLQLREEGLLDLSDPLGAHLPGVGYADRTLRSLLAHSSGMQSEPAGSWWERSPGSDFEELAAAVDDRAAVFEPGRTYHYSNRPSACSASSSPACAGSRGGTRCAPGSSNRWGCHAPATCPNPPRRPGSACTRSPGH
jgi:CubicO group peptidase (beta-lactamase class C family)